MKSFTGNKLYPRIYKKRHNIKNCLVFRAGVVRLQISDCSAFVWGPLGGKGTPESGLPRILLPGPMETGKVKYVISDKHRKE